MVTGLRMNHAYVRIGGLSMDLPPGAEDHVRGFLRLMPGLMLKVFQLKKRFQSR